MHVTLLQSDFAKGLNYVSKAVSGRTQLPILANILLEASSTGLTVSATNLEQGIRVEVEGKVDQTGALTVPAKNLSELVSSMVGGQIQLTAENDKLTLQSGSTKAVLAGISAAEFPVLPKLTEKGGGRLTTHLVKELAMQVAYAAAVDESRPVLTGVRFAVTEGRLLVMATDGFRLSRKQLTEQAAISDTVILPAKAIQELARITADIGESDIEMQVLTGNNQVIFSCGKIQLISRLLEGNFPDTEKIIPASFKTKVTFDRSDLTKAIRTMSIFARESNNIIKLNLEKETCLLKAAASGSGEGEVNLEIELQGETAQIAFNYKYLLDFLTSIESERIVMQMNDPLSATVFTPDQNSDLIHLIMPVRI